MATGCALGLDDGRGAAGDVLERAQTLAPLGAPMSDAGRQAVEDDRSTRDATAPVPEGDAGACRAGQVACGATCIDAIQPTLAALRERVFQRSCALTRACHTGSAPQAGLDLGTIDAIRDGTVGKRSSQVPERSLVAPGKPEDSYVVHKLRALDTVGSAMPPPPAAPLCEAKIQAVEAWIREGATH